MIRWDESASRPTFRPVSADQLGLQRAVNEKLIE